MQFDTASLAGISSVAETASLLAGGGIEFEVIRGLGLAGMVLVRSSGASLEAVEGWLADRRTRRRLRARRLSQSRPTQRPPTIRRHGSQWDMTRHRRPGRLDHRPTGSSSVVVAVIDTGVDYNHVDLAANIWTNPGEIAGNGIDDDGNGFVDDVHGYDFANNDGNPMDDNGHGTHVAGTIAAVGNNSLGVTGVAWSTSIMPLKFLSANGSGYLSDAVEAINYATMMRTRYGVNVRVDNNSWGGGGFSSAMQSAIQAANDAGILFVAAAGNSGTNNDASPQYPANYDSPNVISVAATDQNGQLASFSNYGATTVDLAAPGVSIYSTTPNNTYSTYSGTSMATPHVSAVAALAWALNPDATVAEVRKRHPRRRRPGVARSAASWSAAEVLNAYNTLQLIAAGASSDKPTLESVDASVSSTTAGSAVILTASGIADPAQRDQRAVRVGCQRQRRYDNGEMLLGATSNILGGKASLAFNTSGFMAGKYNILAVAQDSLGDWSDSVSTTLTVLAADDYGNTAATAGAGRSGRFCRGQDQYAGRRRLVQVRGHRWHYLRVECRLGHAARLRALSLRHQRPTPTGQKRRLQPHARLANHLDRQDQRHLLPRRCRLREPIYGHLYAQRPIENRRCAQRGFAEQSAGRVRRKHAVGRNPAMVRGPTGGGILYRRRSIRFCHRRRLAKRTSGDRPFGPRRSLRLDRGFA